MRSVVHINVAVAISAAVQSAQAQLRWAQSSPEARVQAAVVYDSARRETVLIGGRTVSGAAYPQGTFVYKGAGWARVAYGNPPASYPVACYDSLRSRTVVICGVPGVGAIWEWDGSAWNVTSAVLPQGVGLSAMAFDGARGVSVSFGTDGKFYEWNGVTLSVITPLASLDLANYAMAFDSQRNNVVIAGRSRSNGNNFLTWTWDGTHARRRSLWLGGVGGSEYSMAYDAARDRMVIFSGDDGGQPSETWLWNGVSWTKAPASPVTPSGRFLHRLCYDSARQRVVMFGGQVGEHVWEWVPCGDTWEWNGVSWEMTVPSPPIPLFGTSMAFDEARSQTVMFGGVDVNARRPGDTSTLDSAGWMKHAASGPSSRIGAAMCWDSARGHVVMFGGTGDSNATQFGDTWTWNGATWSQGANGPSSRGTSMAFDPDRAQVVLFGGYGDSPLNTKANLSDTWVFDGSAWTQLPVTGPSARSGHAMAWDPSTRRILLFGGALNQGLAGDTWAWDGTQWTLIATTGPSPRHGSLMVTDPDAGRTLLWGGFGNGYPEELWSHQNGTWNLVPITGPHGRVRHSMAYDSHRHAAVLFGGTPNGGIDGDTWLLSQQSLTLQSGPQSQNIPAGSDLTLTIEATGTLPFLYQWSKNGVPMVESARVDGVLGPQLHITGFAADDVANYAVRVEDLFGGLILASANVGLSCAADFNGDTAVDCLDYDQFVTCFEGVACPEGATADFDGDGSVDFFDYDGFVVAFEVGC